jgi:D-alanyl-D-alanine carboxypeptidase/D-alanyl-D-alanine-endopeptidase (penicillin-binding protein 4)
VLGPLLAKHAVGPKTSGIVLDAATGQELYSRGGWTPRTPASTTKLMTAVSLLATVGPSTTLTTKVVQPGPGKIVLVAGGDAQLASGAGSPTATFGRAGLGDLARSTATALKAAGQHRVTLALDDSLFSGPRINPHWASTDPPQGLVGPITPLALAGRQPQPGKPSPADPSMTAAAAFATDLRHDGITVARSIARTHAPGSATELARVESAPIEALLTTTLALSDNTEAEVLARLAAHATGRPATFAGAVAAVRAEVSSLGVPLTGVRIYDGSGLSRADLIPGRILADVLAAAARSTDSRLRALFPALPIAGYSGTLAPRYHHGAERVGLGVVRAKTGTLSGVISLAGVAVDRSGRLLVFAFMASKVPLDADTAARLAIDKAAATVASCGCT